MLLTHMCLHPCVMSHAGTLEMELARSMTLSPPQQPFLLTLATLRLRDAERVAVHNEIEHVKVGVWIAWQCRIFIEG